ncbi:unnamed protein product [Prunus brigantina]
MATGPSGPNSTSNAERPARSSHGIHQPGQAHRQKWTGLLPICKGKQQKRKTITHGSSSEQCPQSVPVVRSVSEIMALLHHLKENTPPCCDPVESPLPMIKPSLYSIVSDYEDREYFSCMMSE